MENYSDRDGVWAYCVHEKLLTSPDLATEKMAIEPMFKSVLDPDAIFILKVEDLHIECNFPQISNAIGLKYGLIKIAQDYEEDNEFYELLENEGLVEDWIDYLDALQERFTY